MRKRIVPVAKLLQCYLLFKGGVGVKYYAL